MASQYEALKHDYDTLLKMGEDPNSKMMRCLRDQIASMERTEYLKKLLREEPERYHFLMSGPNINE